MTRTARGNSSWAQEYGRTGIHGAVSSVAVLPAVSATLVVVAFCFLLSS